MLMALLELVNAASEISVFIAPMENLGVKLPTCHMLRLFPFRHFRDRRQ
jgi:hypothetical protein